MNSQRMGVVKEEGSTAGEGGRTSCQVGQVGHGDLERSKQNVFLSYLCWTLALGTILGLVSLAWTSRRL